MDAIKNRKTDTIRDVRDLARSMCIWFHRVGGVPQLLSNSYQDAFNPHLIWVRENLTLLTILQMY